MSTWHHCSFLLTVVNIICIIVTGIIILKVKQVTSDKIPQRNHSFWKQDIKAWLPDGDSQILRLYVFGPSGFWDYGSATLRCKI